jgi:hypothetical protein
VTSASAATRKSRAKSARKPAAVTAKTRAKKGVSSKRRKASALAATAAAAAVTLTVFVVDAVPLAVPPTSNADAVSHPALQLEDQAMKGRGGQLPSMTLPAVADSTPVIQDQKPKGFWRGLFRDIFVGVVANAIIETIKYVLSQQTLVSLILVAL